MVWRSVVINQPARLKREHFALLVEQDQAARVPFEDIAVIVLNHREITLTHPVLSACAEYGIGLYATGDNHQPSGVFLPFQSHSRATKMLRLQLALDKPTGKRAWSAIVRAKVENQAFSTFQQSWPARPNTQMSSQFFLLMSFCMCVLFLHSEIKISV